jgi:hypothetical protein
LIPNPIRTVLSSIQASQVRALLMGGQACVLYGAAEFGRDTDRALLPSSQNLARLRQALDHLDGEVIAVPPFESRYLRRGHAMHFRCRHPDAPGLRVDVMTRMRGVASFSRLWARRTSVDLGGTTCEVMALPDLIRAKKTQLASRARVNFWLRELRTPQWLIEVAERWPDAWRAAWDTRGLLKHARPASEIRVGEALLREEREEREADARYWQPLMAELERLRHAAPQASPVVRPPDVTRRSRGRRDAEA